KSAAQHPVLYVGPPLQDLNELPRRIDYHRQQVYSRFYGMTDHVICIETPPLTIRETDWQMPTVTRNNLLRAVAGSNQEAVRHHLKEMLSVIEAEMPELAKL